MISACPSLKNELMKIYIRRIKKLPHKTLSVSYDFFSTKAMLKGLTLQMFMTDLSACMFCFLFAYGLTVDLTPERIHI